VRRRAPYDGSAVDLRRLRTQDDVAVLEGPFSLRFSYLESRDGQDRWVPRWQHKNRLPDLIRLEVRGSAVSLPPLVFRPRSDAEVGCVKEGQAGACSARTGGVLAAPPATQVPQQGPQERRN
jgi:hypothetical protein